MSRPGQEFKGLLPAQSQRPRSHFFGALQPLIRDQFTITSWLCMGAVAQGAIILLLGRIALLPAVVLIFYRFLETFAMTQGWTKNVYTEGVLPKKFSAQIPDELGNYGNKPSDSDVVVLLIGTRCNHPLGLMAPHFKQHSKFFGDMAQSLEDHADEYGFLGMTRWLNSADRETKSEFMMVCYFRSFEGLHAFAHSEHHRGGWDFWNSMTKANKIPHISIYHETYHVPKGHWENIYINSHPSGINTITSKFTDKLSGEEMWASPVVDASKGLLKTSAGRMSRSEGLEHEKYGKDPY